MLSRSPRFWTLAGGGFPRPGAPNSNSPPFPFTRSRPIRLVRHFHDKQESPAHTPHSATCCFFRPLKVTLVQAMPPDRDGTRSFFEDNFDEFHPRWHRATPQAPSTIRSLRTAPAGVHAVAAARSRVCAPV